MKCFPLVSKEQSVSPSVLSSCFDRVCVLDRMWSLPHTSCGASQKHMERCQRQTRGGSARHAGMAHPTRSSVSFSQFSQRQLSPLQSVYHQNDSFAVIFRWHPSWCCFESDKGELTDTSSSLLLWHKIFWCTSTSYLLSTLSLVSLQGFGKLGSAELPPEDTVGRFLSYSQDHLLCCCVHCSHIGHPSHSTRCSGCINKYGSGTKNKATLTLTSFSV